MSAMGPLADYRFLEIAGVGPTQFCGMLLADMGADVIRVERPRPVELGVTVADRFNLLNRGRRSIAVDMKNPRGVELVLQLCDQVEALFEGFRPGVMERLGLGPDPCMRRNERLVYGRMTGWGQTGPLAESAGHDPNYVALSGALDAIGERDGAPVLPLNLVGDFGGGGLYLAMGLLAAILETQKSGKGQVIDCAMVDGAASLMTSFYGLQAAGIWDGRRGHNILDGGAHFFSTYETRDNKYVVIGPLERRFYSLLLEKLGVGAPEFQDQHDAERWPDLKSQLRAIFKTRSRDEWCALLEGSDVCFAPVLSMQEAPMHAHNRARGTFVEIDGVTQPAPAPRFSRTPGTVQAAPATPGQDSVEILRSFGFSAAQVEELITAGVVVTDQDREP